MKYLLPLVLFNLITVLLLQAEPQRLDVKCEIPAASKAIEDAIVVVRVYKYDPLLADRPADELVKMEIKGLDLSSKLSTNLRFPVQFERKSERSYYLTVFVYPESGKEKRLFFIDGFQKILKNAEGCPLELRLKEIVR